MKTLADIRRQYPDYNDLSDRELADKLHAKFYSDMPKAEFDAKVGVTARKGPDASAGFFDRGGRGERLLNTAEGAFENVGSSITRGVGQLVDMAGQARAGEMAGQGSEVPGIPGMYMATPDFLKPELKRIHDQATPVVSPLVNRAVAPIQRRADRVLPKNRDTFESGVKTVVETAAPLLTGPVAPLMFAAQGADTAQREAEAKGLSRPRQRDAAAGSAAVQGAVAVLPWGKAAEVVAAPVLKKVGGGVIAGKVGQILAHRGGDAAMGATMQTGENVVAQQTFDPNRPTLQNVPETAGAMALGGAIIGAVLKSPAGVKAFNRFWTQRGVDPASVPPHMHPEDVADMATDPEIAAVLGSQGITPDNPRFTKFYEVVAARREAAAQRSPVPDVDPRTGVDPTTGYPPAPFRPPAEGESPAAYAGNRTDDAVDAQRQAQDQAAQQQAELQARTQLDPRDPNYIDPAALPTAGVERAPDGRDAPMRVTPDGTVFQPTLDAEVGQELRTPNNLPVPTGPGPMSAGDVAQGQALLRGEVDTGARGNANPIPERNTMTAPEDRAPQNGAQAAENEKARQAFTLAERQRERAGPEVRDTQTAGQPEGRAPQAVMMHGAFPVQPTGQWGGGNTIKVVRYDPRTGQPLQGATPYEVPLGELSERQYEADPRRAQDYQQRERESGNGFRPPELPRDAGPGHPEREPKQTYRTTESAPHAADGGLPFPEQPDGPSPFRDQSQREHAQRAKDEAELRRAYERAQREQADADREAKARARSGSKAGGYSATNKPEAQRSDGRWEIDEDGYVRSDKGGPIVFGDQKAAARWIIKEGHGKSPDQIFELANHPTKKGSFTVVERGRQEAKPEPQAEPGPAPKPEAASQPAADVAQEPRSLPAPAEPARNDGVLRRRIDEAHQEVAEAQAAHTANESRFHAVARREANLRDSVGTNHPDYKALGPDYTAANDAHMRSGERLRGAHERLKAARDAMPDIATLRAERGAPPEPEAKAEQAKPAEPPLSAEGQKKQDEMRAAHAEDMKAADAEVQARYEARIARERSFGDAELDAAHEAVGEANRVWLHAQKGEPKKRARAKLETAMKRNRAAIDAHEARLAEPAKPAETAPQPEKDFRRAETWPSQEQAEKASEYFKNDPALRGREVRVAKIAADKVGGWEWAVEVERTPADAAASAKLRQEAEAREADQQAKADAATQGRAEKMTPERLDAEMEAALKRSQNAGDKRKRDAAMAEYRVLRAQRDALERAESEGVEHSPRPDIERPAEAKSRVATELDAMIARARELDEAGQGSARLRYEMTTASGRKSTFTMKADPKLWEGLKDRILNKEGVPLDTPAERGSRSGQVEVSYEHDGQPVTKEVSVNKGHLIQRKGHLKDRFNHQPRITRREALAGAAAATVAGAPGKGRADAPEVRTAFAGGPIGQAVKSGDANRVLAALADHAASAPIRWAARLMAKNGGMGDTKIRTSRDLEDGVAGTTNMTSGEVTLRNDPASPYDGMNEETAAHELIHAFVSARYRALSSYLDSNLKRWGVSPVKAAETIQELQDLWRAVSNAIELKFPGVASGEGEGLRPFHQQMYSDPDEMLSWALTNPEAQAFLKSLDTAGGDIKVKTAPANAWERFVAWVAKLFGQEPQSTPTMWSRVLDTSERFFTEAGGDAPDRRIAQRSEAFQAGQRFNQDKRPPSGPAKGPMSKDEVEALRRSPEVKRAVPRMQQMQKSAAENAALLRDLKTGVGGVGAAATAVRRLYDFFNTTNGQAIRIIGDHYEAKGDARSKAAAEKIHWLADQISTNPGSGRVVGETWERAWSAQLGTQLHRIDTVLGPHSTPELESAVVDILAGRKRAANAPEADAARAIRGVLNDQWHYLADAGVDVGYVPRDYFPRSLDGEKVEANRAGFLAAAAKMYEKTGLVTGTKRDELGRTPAEQAADAWYDRLIGVTEDPHSHMSASQPMQGRVLPKEADELLKDYLNTDLRSVMVNYLRSTSRAAESARRFGAKGEKVTDAFNVIKRAGVPKAELKLLQAHFDSATGHLFNRPNDASAPMSGVLQTYGVLRSLPHAVFSSMAEGLAVGSVSADFRKGAVALVDSWREMTALRQKDDAAAVAEYVGVIGETMNNFLMAARAGGEAGSRVQRAWVGKFFRAQGLTQLTEAQRISALRIARQHIKQLVREVATGHARAKSAGFLLRDLGVSAEDAHALHAWISKANDEVGIGMLSDGSKMAQLYKVAMRRFIDESIQNPTAADRPLLANHPMARFAYSLQSFNYSYVKNILARSAKTMAEGMTGDYGHALSADRLRLVGGPVVALMAVIGGQALMSEFRDTLLSNDGRHKRTQWERFMTMASRSNVFGNFDRVANGVFGAQRYNQNPAVAAAGPYLGGMASDAATLLQGGKAVLQHKHTNSPWRARRVLWTAAAVPLLGAAAALVPEGNAALRFGSFVAHQWLTGSDTADDVANAGGVRPHPPKRRS